MQGIEDGANPVGDPVIGPLPGVMGRSRQLRRESSYEGCRRDQVHPPGVEGPNGRSRQDYLTTITRSPDEVLNESWWVPAEIRDWKSHPTGML